MKTTELSMLVALDREIEASNGHVSPHKIQAYRSLLTAYISERTSASLRRAMTAPQETRAA